MRISVAVYAGSVTVRVPVTSAGVCGGLARNSECRSASDQDDLFHVVTILLFEVLNVR
jgi:hypothetical protein